MQLTRHTDYALRLLICLAQAGDQRVSIGQVAETQDISRTHLMKVANHLVHAGFIEGVRGRGGGIRLARAADQINIGDVVAAMEPNCELVDCTACRLIRGCTLPLALRQAKAAFLEVLRQSTLADIMR
ncbi:Rrf2 family transcriptional regulator [Novosphingobium sp. FSY-8]|uniref:Rrf2 family transcriptional regulator n=1 Tax=Novosphingobium ovatum TaxID=1908523 RepID=A0ABW9XDX4_9SPHN|nr:Rrf2 family transcriptional regulator [Novosphingobium ovatum]NBC36647.1 Rrf2 family transcriptional regulator [Novosphingobium ovatum]